MFYAVEGGPIELESNDVLVNFNIIFYHFHGNKYKSFKAAQCRYDSSTKKTPTKIGYLPKSAFKLKIIEENFLERHTWMRCVTFTCITT